VARYFNVTLVKLPPSPMGLGGLKPVPATAEMSPPEVPAQRLNVIQQTQQQTTMPMAQTQPEGMNKQNYPGLNAPQYTAG